MNADPRRNTAAIAKLHSKGRGADSQIEPLTEWSTDAVFVPLPA
jgi:hypothetical protein